MMRGQVLNFIGRPEHGLAEVELAIRHNPHHPDWYLLGIARAHHMLGNYAQAIPPAERLVTAAPDLAGARLLLIASYVGVGRTDAAQAEMATCLARHPDLTSGQVATIVPFQHEADLARLPGFAAPSRPAGVTIAAVLRAKLAIGRLSAVARKSGP